MRPLTISFQRDTIAVLADLHLDSNQCYWHNSIGHLSLLETFWSAGTLNLAGYLANDPARNWEAVFQLLIEYKPADCI